MYDFFPSATNPSGDPDLPNGGGLTFNIIRQNVRTIANLYDCYTINWNDANMLYPEDLTDGIHPISYEGRKKIENIMYQGISNIYTPININNITISQTIDLINTMVVKA